MDEIVKRLLEDGVFVDHYYFDSDPRDCLSSDSHQPHLALQDLALRYPNHRLMIFSDGADLLNPISGMPHRWLELFTPWSERALFTPEDPVHWGFREWVLSSTGFLVLPANEVGLATFIETLHSGSISLPSGSQGLPSYPDVLQDQPTRWLEQYPPEPADMDNLCEELLRFLGDEGYFWLSACAVYPELHWELTLYLGNKLTDVYGHPLLTEERLLALARLPWLRHGSMPDWLRLRLIAALPKSQERDIRKILEKLLQTASQQSHTHDGFVLAIASKSPGLRWYSWPRLIPSFLRTSSTSGPLQDYVFVAFITGQKLTKLAVTVPTQLRRIIFRQGQKVLGVRPATALLMATIISFAAYTLVREQQPDISASQSRPGINFHIYFGPDSSEISADGMKTLDQIGEALTSEALTECCFRIEGHTDSAASASYNQQISQRRAQRVARYLVEKFSIDPERLTAVGLGESDPIATNQTEEGRRQNGRVTIVNLGYGAPQGNRINCDVPRLQR